MNMRLIKYIDRYLGIPICYILYFTDLLKPKKNSNNIKNILIIKFSGFGNLILSLPAVKSIKKEFPESRIFYLTDNANRNLLEGQKDIDEIIYLKVKGYRILYDFLRILSKIRRLKIDLVIDFEQFVRISTILSYLSGAQKRIGFDTEKQGRGMLYTTKIKYNNEQHMLKTFYDLAIAVGVKDKDYDFPRLEYSDYDQELIRNYISKTKRKTACIHPGAGKNVPGRKWPKEKFAELADELIKRYNLEVYFTGSEDEKILVQDIITKMKNKAYNLAGKLTLKQLSLFVSKCYLIVTNDTGPLHLASLNNTPSISFFGPNTPKLYGPIGNNHLIMYNDMHCSPCITNFNEKSTRCKHFECLKNIEVNDVLIRLSKNSIIK